MEVIRQDVGLGTAYERVAIYGLVERWLGGRAIETAIEGPIDAMAGIAGLHLVGLAATGVRVSSLHVETDAADVARVAVRSLGLEDTVTVEISPELRGRSADAVLSFGALARVGDWRVLLDDLFSAASRFVLVVVPNPRSYGARARSLLWRLEKERGDESHAHESSRPEVLEPELERRGRILDRAWLDAPWWPDLFVAPGETLVSGTLRRFGEGSKSRVGEPSKRQRFVFPAEDFPYAGGRAPAEVERVLARHPSFEHSGRLAPIFAHHRAYLVSVSP